MGEKKIGCILNLVTCLILERKMFSKYTIFILKEDPPRLSFRSFGDSLWIQKTISSIQTVECILQCYYHHNRMIEVNCHSAKQRGHLFFLTKDPTFPLMSLLKVRVRTAYEVLGIAGAAGTFEAWKHDDAT